MSCYGFETGEVKLPAKEWKGFRDSMYSRYNEKLQETYEKALSLHSEVSKKMKGKSVQKKKEYLKNRLDRIYGCSLNHYAQLILNSIFPSLDKKFLKPKKKNFAHKKASKGETLRDDFLSVSFCNKTKTVFYEVKYNNHSIEYARESFLGRLFFKLINRVAFTSRTGGYLAAQTEYDQDEEGFYTSPRITERWGKYNT